MRYPDSVRQSGRVPAPVASPIPLTWDQVRGHRLRRHGLSGPLASGSIVRAAGTVCGIHGQVASAAALSLARRVRDAPLSALSDGLADRSLVKTYGPRGTVHVFPSQELTLWTAATRAMPDRGSRQPALATSEAKLTAEQSEQLRAAVRAVTTGTQFTRNELGEAITAECGPWADAVASPAWNTGWSHWRLAVDEAVARGELCFGAPQGNRVTFVRTDEWLAETVTQEWTKPDGTMIGTAPAVLVEVARHYLGAYGPATHQEFAQWFALPAGLGRQVYAALSDELIAVDVEGTRSWALRDSEPDTWQPVEKCLRLLGYFDCFAVGCHPRDELAPPAAAEQARAHARGFAKGSARRFLCGPLPVLLIDGVVCGVWTYRREGAADQVRVEVFGPGSAAPRKLLAAEVARLAALTDRDLELSVGPADIAAHL